IAEHTATDQGRDDEVLLLHVRHPVLEDPAVEEVVEIGLFLGLAPGFALRGDRTVGLDRYRTVLLGAGIPGVYGAQRIADLLRMDGGDRVLAFADAVKGLALGATLTVENQVLGGEYL